MSTTQTPPDSDQTADLPGFVSPEPRPTTREAETTAATSPDPMTTRDGYRLDDDELDPPTLPTSGSSSGRNPSSTSKNGPSPVSTAEVEAGWAGIVTIGLSTAGLVANGRLAPGTPLWLMTEHDLASIAAPASRILARHVPVGVEKAGDLADAAEIAVGAAGYALANLQAARAMQAHAVPQAAPAPPPTDRAPSPAAPTVATPDLDDGGPVAPTGAVELGTFHDHFPPL